MSILILINRQPYDGSDLVWNALRLAKTLRKHGNDVRIFLMNDAVDLARESTRKPDFYDFDLVDLLKTLWHEGVRLKVCGTCMARCGLHKNEPYFAGDVTGTMDNLAEWIASSDKVLSF